MTNSNAPELDRERTSEQRRQFVVEWANYVRTTPDEEWGEQVRDLIDSQLEAAQALEATRPDPERVERSPLLE